MRERERESWREKGKKKGNRNFRPCSVVLFTDLSKFILAFECVLNLLFSYFSIKLQIVNLLEVL
jgi:hypothetical protein